MPRHLPRVSVVMPIRNEAETLRAAVDAVLTQDYEGPLEVVLGVAPSEDATETIAADIADRDQRVTIVPNPKESTSAGLNAAIAASTGSVIVRVDGHSRLTDGYISRAVELLEETGADNVGGIQEAVGETAFEQAVAVAMSSRFGTGDAKFHYGGRPGPTDTVYLGVFRRDVFDRVGCFDETLLRNQDYDLNWRIRAAGGTVYFHPDLRVRYRPRGSLRALAKQYFEYGRWKREMLRRHPRSLRWRHLVPPMTLVATAAGVLASVGVSPLFLLLPALYLGFLVGASIILSGARLVSSVRMLSALFLIHMAWAAGFLHASLPVIGRLTTLTPAPRHWQPSS